MDMIQNSLGLGFAGLGPFIAHWSLAITAMVLCIGGALMSSAIPIIGPYLGAWRTHLLWAAFAIGLLMVGHVVGVADEKGRCVAQTKVVTKTVDRVVKKARPQVEGGWKDPWNRKEY